MPSIPPDFEPEADRSACPVIVFVKAPWPGTVKTRLARDIGNEAAALLYRHFVLDVLELTGDKGERERVICCDPPHAWRDIREWLGPDYRYRPQSSGDLGDRMRDAFEAAFADGFDRALLLGTDLPDLPPETIQMAESGLRSADVVLGPSLDGGYYLIGFNRRGFEPAVFRGIAWSSDRVLRQTETILARHGRRVRRLPPWGDIDDLSDLRDLIRRSRTHKRAAHTRRCLTHQLKRKDDATMADKPDIQVYALTTCSHCKAAKRLLDDCTVQYDVVNVDTLEGDERKAILDDVKKFNPKCTFPTIIIGDKIIVGFKEKEIKEALGL